MINLLKNQFVLYLNSRKPHLPPFNGSSLQLKTEIVEDAFFDIMDKKPTICQPLGQGSAKYYNPDGRKITFIDYEDFIGQLPPGLHKGLKRCDFIAYDTHGTSFFILNELSQSSTSGNKISDARQQLHQAALYFHETTVIHHFINTFTYKKCIFSNKHKLIPTPAGIADAFNLIQGYLPEPISHKYQPIEKLGFDFIETAIIKV